MTQEIQRRRRFGPIAPPPVATVRVGDGESFVVPARLSADEGERLGREAIQEGMARPADSHRADIETAQLVWVPLWRVDASADGFHVGVRQATDAKGRLRAVLPTGGARHRDEVVVLLARKMLPFDPSPGVKLPLDAMASKLTHPIAEGEEVAPDVTREEAEREASARVRRHVQPSSAVYSNYEVRVRSAVLCHYPVWLRRYRYEGEAAGSGEVFEGHVALSAVDGRVLSARHPPAWRALAGRVKRLFKRG